MKTCSEECSKHPCCLYCIHILKETINQYGTSYPGEIKGCKLHPDREHSIIVDSLGYCDDFECINLYIKSNRK